MAMERKTGYNSNNDTARKRADAMARKSSKKEYDDEDEYDDKEAAKRAGRGCLITFLVVFLVIAGLLLAGFFYVKGEIDGNNATAEGIVTVEIPSGSGGTAVATVLKEAGLIGDERIFRFYVRFNGMSNVFQKGQYKLESGMSYDEMIDALSQPPPPRDTIQVMIPKGSTVQQFAAKMEEANLCTKQEFIDAANDLEAYSDIPMIARLLEEYAEDGDEPYMRAEGFLEPNTYDFFVDGDAYYIVRKLFEQMDKDLTDNGYYERMDEQGLSLRQTMALASMIEEEASEPDENQAAVAGVYWNRLTKDLPQGAAGRRLECDATLLYIRDWIAPDFGGDVSNVPEEWNLKYDTYEREGLPAGAISCPGMTAIQAALYPELNDYFYYFVDPTGEYHYNKTFSQHQADINRYGVKGQDDE